MDHDHSHHDHDHSHHDHGSSSAGCMSGHMMVFHFGVCQEILFSGWVTTNALEIFFSSLAIFVAGFLYEGMKYVRESRVHRDVPFGRESQMNIPKNECGPSNNGTVQTASVIKRSMFSLSHFIQTGLHFFQTTVSYILMLVFMTYNVWLCIALVLGMTLGYFVFGWRKKTVIDTNEHCQ